MYLLCCPNILAPLASRVRFRTLDTQIIYIYVHDITFVLLRRPPAVATACCRVMHAAALPPAAPTVTGSGRDPTYILSCQWAVEPTALKCREYIHSRSRLLATKRGKTRRRQRLYIIMVLLVAHPGTNGGTRHRAHTGSVLRHFWPKPPVYGCPTLPDGVPPFSTALVQKRASKSTFKQFVPKMGGSAVLKA